MKKISYWSSDEKPLKPEKWAPVDLVGRDKESATDNAGRNGWALLEMTREPGMGGGTEPTDYESGIKKEKTGEEIMEEDLMDLFVFLGDELDKGGEHRLSNFADFMIKKIAESREADFTEKYNDLMIKINNSDIPDRNETIKKLTKIYSRTLVLEFMDKDNINMAKESAYKKTLHRADQYLSER